MRTEFAKEVISIGKQGENNATEVLFDIADWNTRFGEGTYALLHKRHGDTAPYPAAVTVSADKVRWIITSSDVENEGIGEAELTLTISGAIAKSRTFLTVTEASLPGAGTPPAPYVSWVSDVLEAADDAVEAKEAIEDMSATAHALPAGQSPTVTKSTVQGHINLDFGIPASQGSGVDSVNGQTGTVVLDAEDVGALPDTTAIPTKTSDLTNDSGFLTQHQSLAAYRTGAAQDAIDGGKLKSDALAEDYGDLTFPVSAGKLCIHSSGLYKANQAISAYEPWTAAHWDETSAESEFARTGAVTVTVTASDSTSPAGGVSVQLLIGDTVMETKAYTGQPVTFEGLTVGVVYTVKTTGTWTGKYDPNPSSYSFTATPAAAAVTITYSLISQISTLAQLSRVIKEGCASQLTIGQQITIPWTDTATNTAYQVLCDIVDYRAANDPDHPIIDENGEAHEGIRIQWHYVTPFDIQFDAPEQVEATEETAVSGIYYYGYSGSGYTLLQLSAGDAIPYGSYSTVYKNEIRDISCAIIGKGYARYRDSAWRQFLCSENGVGQWWAATHVGDAAPTQLNSRAGFLSGFSAEDLALMKRSKITCYTNSVTDGSVIDTMYDKWYPASATEMYGSVNANEGSFFPYWKAATGFASASNNASSARIAYHLAYHTNAKWHWLRSAGRATSCGLARVGSSGAIGSYENPGQSGSTLPVCAIY